MRLIASLLYKQLVNFEHVVFINLLFKSIVNLYYLWLLQVMYGGYWIVHLNKFGLHCIVGYCIHVVCILTNILGK